MEDTNFPYAVRFIFIFYFYAFFAALGHEKMSTRALKKTYRCATRKTVRVGSV